MRRIFTLLAGLTMSLASFAQWSLTGNAGTNPPTNFLGTTDNEPLVFKTNATEYMRLLTNGRLGIGTTSPVVQLHIYGATNSNCAITGSAPGIYFSGGTTINSVSNGVVG